MRLKTGLLVIIALLSGAFLVLNWRSLSAPASVNFLFGSVTLPVGAVLLAMLALGGIALAVYLFFWQRQILGELRQQALQLQAKQSLVDDAEASRITALGTLVREQSVRLEQRFEQSLDALRREIGESERSLAAILAEMDDRQRQATAVP